VRIASIELSWFRGAASSDRLESAGRSIAVYGANGAGKSSFVDALEYTLSDGRIRHLAHEYSGRHQERAILNTHRPANVNGEIAISFADNTTVHVRIAAAGTFTMSGDGKDHLVGWDCRRTLLRQDEVSEFVHSTKGEKYSVLLPLLGLGHLEIQAENLRQLGASVIKQSGIREANAALRGAQIQLESVSGRTGPETAATALTALCEVFVSEAHSHSADQCPNLVENAINGRLDDATSLQRIQIAVEELANSDVKSAVARTRTSAALLAEAADGAVQRQLEVLTATRAFLDAVPAQGVSQCPACGLTGTHADLSAHVVKEMARLNDVLDKSAEFQESINALRRTADRIISLCKREEIRVWSTSQGDARLPPIIAAAASLTFSAQRLSDPELETVAKVLGAAVMAAASAAAFLPTPAAELARAKERLLSLRSLLKAEAAVAQAAKGEDLAAKIARMESDVRQQIRTQTGSVVTEISSAVQRMWRILHPGDPIEDVRLHVPADADKAIDISLKFHGKNLESPRLTLSEGYRNSLGLCVFLAMAARDTPDNRPIVLDDVIVSLDRGHRGMLIGLLQAEFAERQVLLFTHDREWYADLRQQLGEREWSFRALVPYRSPSEGIRWSHRVGTFDDARGFLSVRPDVAANEARKVMDVELAMHAERLAVRLTYARGERNDKRTAHEFLERLIADGKSVFKIKDTPSGRYIPYKDGVQAFVEADKLLMTWANRGSHSEDVVASEAERLIEVCEGAIVALKCRSCEKFVHFAEVAADESRQCQCGTLKWK
jgi:recombinational DNA repair ATPase RecF